LLLLAGDFEEFISPARLKARSDARLELSPWSDHALEVWDPHLVNAGVEAACVAVGKPPPRAPRFWLWRLAGVVFGMAGSVWFDVAFAGPQPCFGGAGGFCCPRHHHHCGRLYDGQVGWLVPEPSSPSFAAVDRSYRLAGPRGAQKARPATDGA